MICQDLHSVVYKMAVWQNVIDVMASGQNGKMLEWQVDKMASGKNGKLTRWQGEKMASGQDGK